jgi:hypothetical protein
MQAAAWRVGVHPLNLAVMHDASPQEWPLSCPNCDPEVVTAVPGRRPGATSPPHKGDAADLQFFENENQIVRETSYPAYQPIESAPQPARRACEIHSESTIVGSLLVKPVSTSRESLQLAVEGRSPRDR